MSARFRIVFVEVVSAFLTLLFVYTGISKLIDHASFQATIKGLPIFSSLSEIISVFIPAFELVVALLIVIRKYRQKGLLLAFAIMVVFTLYVGYVLLFESKLPCSCGGVLKVMSWKEHFLFNVSVSILSLVTFLSYTKNNRFIAIDRLSRKPV